MGTRMSPGEKLRHYHHQILSFENKRGLALGKYTISEYVLLAVLGLWLAYLLPTLMTVSALYSLAALVTGLLVVYILLLFFISGGRGRVVDVI